jgi:dTMP kinase
MDTRLIIFEGVDGVGKTTQINLCYEWLKTMGLDVIKTKEPYNDWVKKIIPDDNSSTLSNYSKALIYMADRYDHVENILEKNIGTLNKIILSDRSVYSTVAYQLSYDDAKDDSTMYNTLFVLHDHFIELYDELDHKVIFFKRRTDDLKNIDERYLEYIPKDSLIIEPDTIDNTFQLIKKKIIEWSELEI